MSISIENVTSFADDPHSRTVTVSFKSGETVLLEALSRDNYTPPPGFGQSAKDIDITECHRQMTLRKIRYYDAVRDLINVK